MEPHRPDGKAVAEGIIWVPFPTGPRSDQLRRPRLVGQASWEPRTDVAELPANRLVAKADGASPFPNQVLALHFPQPRQIGPTVGGPRSWSREVRLSIGRSRHTRCGVIEPLGRDRGERKHEAYRSENEPVKQFHSNSLHYPYMILLHQPGACPSQSELLLELKILVGA